MTQAMAPVTNKASHGQKASFNDPSHGTSQQ